MRSTNSGCQDRGISKAIYFFQRHFDPMKWFLAPNPHLWIFFTKMQCQIGQFFVCMRCRRDRSSSLYVYFQSFLYSFWNTQNLYFKKWKKELIKKFNHGVACISVVGLVVWWRNQSQPYRAFRFNACTCGPAPVVRSPLIFTLQALNGTPILAWITRTLTHTWFSYILTLLTELYCLLSTRFWFWRYVISVV